MDAVGFSSKQMQVLSFPYMKEKFNAIIADGSIRSGKTVSMIIGYITWAMHNFNKCSFALCGKTVKVAERNLIKALWNIQYFHDEFTMSYVKNDSLLTIKRGSTTNYFYIFGGKDESSYQLIQGVTLAGAFFDEVALMPESFVNQATGRCSVDGSLFWFNCNPEDPNHWFYNSWIKKSNQMRALYLHFTMQDNPSLSDKIKQRYESMYEGVFYQRYIKGEWVKAEGIIYRRFSDNPELYIVDNTDDITFMQVGVDFGGTGSGTSFVAVGFNGFKHITVLESVRYVDKEFKNPSPYDIIIPNLTPDLLDELYAQFCQMLYEKYKKAFVTRADSAEQVLIRGLRSAVAKKHLHTEIRNARKNEIIDRIKLVLKLTGQNRFRAARQAKTFIEAMKNAVWDAKRTDTRLDDGTSDIDTLDAFEYAIEEYTTSLLESYNFEPKEG
jgi:PBSX family phage terminase large subunit